MNPLTTSAFDLPDRLSPKADPRLIADDEVHFTAIAASLRQTLAELSDRLDAERRAPGGVGPMAGSLAARRGQPRGNARFGVNHTGSSDRKPERKTQGLTA